MTIEVFEQLEPVLKQQAAVHGISPTLFVNQVLQGKFEEIAKDEAPLRPLKDSRGILAKYGPAPTKEEIDENRVDMLRNSIFARDAE